MNISVVFWFSLYTIHNFKCFQVDVPVVGDGTCSLEYPLSIAESMLCAGERGKDSCQVF